MNGVLADVESKHYQKQFCVDNIYTHGLVKYSAKILMRLNLKIFLKRQCFKKRQNETR